MIGETNLQKLIQTMNPVLNDGKYVFCTVTELGNIPLTEVVGMFREQEGMTLFLPQHIADKYAISYDFVMAWITLNVHSSLEAVGLTAAFATALGAENISCNVVAGFYHDHIFVDVNDGLRAIEVLEQMKNS
ncbi:MAG: ACT domain-containing protein [Saprospiraceae bacterium]